MRNTSGTWPRRVALAAFVALGLSGMRSPERRATVQAAGPTPVLSDKSIDGIECNALQQLTYHVHAHLAIRIKGRRLVVSPNVGHDDSHQCLYWVHTHRPDGIIHIEAPRQVVPTLGAFFDIWGEPLSRRQVGPAPARGSQSVRAYVNLRRYLGDPRSISIHPHTFITLEVGPPFVRPHSFNFPDGM